MTHDPTDLSATESPRSRWLYPLILAGIVVVLYGWTVSFDFVDWDDHYLIPANPHVRQPSARSLQTFWTEGYIKIYMPITYTLWMVEAAPARLVAKMAGYDQNVTPLAPGIYHFTTVLLFMGCVLQLYRLLTRLVVTRFGAFMGALLYAVHPIQVEAAAWVSENKGLLATLFGFSALICYIDFTRAKTNVGRGLMYAAATALFGFALLSKPSAVALPLVAALIDWGLLRRSLLAVLPSIAPWIILSALMVYVTNNVQGDAITEPAEIAQRPFIVLHSLGFYLVKLVFPFRLAPSYEHGPSDVLALVSNPEIFGAIGLAAIGIVLLGLWFMGQRTAAVVLAIFLVALAPNLGFANFAYQAISTTADRYLAAAMFAPALGVAYWLSWTKSPVAKWAMIGVCAVFGLLSIAQTSIWRDSDHLIGYQLRLYPESAIFLNNRAVVRLREGDYEGARDDAAQALEYWPNLPGALANLAQAQGRMGDVDTAIETLKLALADNPNDRPAVDLAAKMLQYRRRYEEALEPARLAASFPEANRSDRLRYARLLILSGKEAEGIAAFAEARGKEILRPEDQVIIAQVFEHAGEYAKAVARYRKINGDYGGKVPLARIRLAWVLATAPDELVRRPEEALRMAQQLTKNGKEGPPTLMDVLAAAHASVGNFEEARKIADEAAIAAMKDNNPNLAKEIDLRLKLYKKDKPFILPKPDLFPSPPKA